MPLFSSWSPPTLGEHSFTFCHYSCPLCRISCQENHTACSLLCLTSSRMLLVYCFIPFYCWAAAIVWMYHNFPVNSQTYRLTSCSQFGLSWVMLLVCMSLWDWVFSFLLGKFPWLWILGHVSEKLPGCFSKMAEPFCISTSNVPVDPHSHQYLVLSVFLSLTLW